MGDEYIKSNRQKRMSPKYGKYWCDKCDRCLVSGDEKCPSCGFQKIKRRLKKETNAH